MRRCAPTIAVLVVTCCLSAAARADDSRGDLTNVVAVTQPLAHAQDLLRLPGLLRLLDGLSNKPGGGAKSLAEMQAGLAATAPFWPREIAVGMPTSAFTQVDGLGRGFMLAALCKGATGAGTRAKKELPALQKALAAELRALRVPPLVISASFADAATAKQIAASVADGVRAQLASSGIRPVNEGDAFRVRLRLGRFWSPAQLKAALVGMGWVAGPRDPQAKALGAALAGLEAEAWVAAEGKNVVVTVGPRQPGKALVVPAAPVPLGAGTLLAAAHAEIAPVRKVVADWRALWATWESTAAAARTRADDDTDLLGDLPRMFRTLERWGDRADGWLWTDRGVHGLYRLAGAPSSTPLASEPVAALLPADAVAVDVDARDNLGERLSAAFENIEDRLAKRSFLETVHGGQSSQAEQTELAYYKIFGRLRELVHDKGPKVFTGGSALVVGRGARIGRLDVRDAPGKPPRTSKNVAVPELAWIGRATDAKAALAFLTDIWTTFGAAATSAATGRAPIATSAPTDAPSPAPGAAARWLDASWFDALVGAQVSSDGGFKPQVATRGDTVVLSTSPALTQRILLLAAGAPAKDRMALPPAKAPIVAWARYPCAPLAGQVRAAVAALEAVAGRALDLGSSAKSSTTTKEVADIATLACDVVDGATLTTTEQGGVTNATVDIPAAAALYRSGRK